MHTILCIDDHLPALHSLALLLQFARYRVLTAIQAEEAGRLFRDNRIDLVIVDHDLQGVDGANLAGRLKSVRDVRVLMLTGNPSLARQTDNVDSLLLKPCSLELLLGTLERLLEPRSQQYSD